MEIPITLITTGILGIIFFIHSLRIIQGRGLTKTSLGDGGNDVMTRRIRIHGNFAEYIPLLLFILFLLELTHTNSLLISVFAAALVVGRLFHFYGLYSNGSPIWARVWGMQLTLWPLLISCLYFLYLGLGI